MEETNILSYTKILEDIQQFKKAGTKTGKDFNALDMPSHKYFKILFYFGSNAEFDAINSSGLLSPTWEVFNNNSSNDLQYYNFNSAWAFLKLNDENERAEKLEQFVTLLSDINTNSPWYFSTVGGISEALERKVTEDGKLEIADKTLTIGCLPDAFDNRIGTLLELYRDITWSWVHKRQVIPVNLRKFDMAIYIFESPVDGWNTNVLDYRSSTSDSVYNYYDTTIGYNNHKDFNHKQFNVSYKMLEFHDCEFKYNSIKSGLNELNNQTGFSPTYNIEIVYNDCYEISYNDVMMRTIGDVILTDLVNNSSNDNDYISTAQEDSSAMKELLDFNMKFKASGIPEREEPDSTHIREDKNIEYATTIERKEATSSLNENLKNKTIDNRDEWSNKESWSLSGFIENGAGQVVGHAEKFITSKINRALLGNLYGFSLTKIGTQLTELAQGNLIKSGMSIAQYIKNESKKRSNNSEKPNRNIFDVISKLSEVNEISNGNIFDNNKLSEVNEISNKNIFATNVINNQISNKKLGNIFNKSTIANN